MSLRDNFHALCKTRGLDASGHIGDWSSDFEYDHSHIQIMWEGFQAGAASRDAEVAELVGVLGNVTAHLVAAHSLLSKGGKKAAASDTIFKIMLQDYEKSFEAGRKALAKVRKP